MKLIPLSGKKGEGGVIVVDDDDYEKLKSFKWHLCNKYPSRHYSVHPNGKRVFLTRPIHRFIKIAPKGFVIDHINRNPLDNRKENLRICTLAENFRNVAPTKKKKNGVEYKGISWHKKDKKYHARIKVNGKLIVLGYYKDPKEAALIYNEAAKKYHGEFAYLNTIS